jgi:hypothetical protein
MRFFWCAVLTGCAAYQPGSFTDGQSFPGSRVTLGCIDLAIERRADLIDAAVIDYRFGNRCTTQAPIDLAAVVVVGRTRSGEERRLAPYDPDRELKPLRIDGRRSGHEAIAYPSDEWLAQLCVDAGSLVGASAPQWVCVGDRSDLVAKAAP